MTPDWLLWQIADSAFPAGGFAHSAGLEAAWQAGQVRDGDSLPEFLAVGLSAAARGVGIFAAVTARAPQRFGEVDAACDLFLNNHVANRASVAQGQAFLRVANEIFGSAALERLGKLVRRERLFGHYSPVFGACTAALGIDPPAACRLFMFMFLRGLVSSAVRLGIVGPLEGQSLQCRLSPRAEELAGILHAASMEDVVQTLPLHDLLQGAHDRLYSRLFQS